MPFFKGEKMGIKIITNNLKVKNKYSDQYEVEYIDTDYMGILYKARGMIHLGHEMYTHPLSSSIKPNETPYKSIIMSDKAEGLKFESLQAIESGIHTAEKFQRDFKTPDWTERVKEDFREIDCSIIANALNIRKW